MSLSRRIPPCESQSHWRHLRARELCESRGGRPGLPSLISLRFLWTWSNTSTNHWRHLCHLPCFPAPESAEHVVRNFAHLQQSSRSISAVLKGARKRWGLEWDLYWRPRVYNHAFSFSFCTGNCSERSPFWTKIRDKFCDLSVYLCVNGVCRRTVFVPWKDLPI